MSAQEERPRFYEGQYLSAADLAAIVEYLRTAHARHQLGAHTWGIAIGLHLVERPAPGEPERREMILQPGVAWDGLGRAIVVARPTRVAEAVTGIARDASVDTPGPNFKGRLVKAWLQYDESATRPPAAGFAACTGDDQTARVRESFRIVFGDIAGADQRARLSVGGQTVDATDAIHYFDSGKGPVYDASIPHQAFPARKPPPRWLVPIGYVRWVALTNDTGYFARLDLAAADKAAQRTEGFRRYLGVVAEDIAAAHRAIVLRRRDDKPDDPHHYAALLNDPLLVDELQKDLVWVEGNLRVRGDEKLNGGLLHFRNDDGDDRKTPLFLSRAGDSNAADGARELRVGLGDDNVLTPAGAKQNDNKLVVGPIRAGAAPVDPRTQPLEPRLVVRSGSPTVAAEGRVGVNTADPQAALEVKGDWTNNEEGALRLSGQQPAIRFEGGADVLSHKWVAQLTSTPQGAWRVAHRVGPADWKGVLFATPTHRVGVDTPAPRNPLGVRAEAAAAGWEELVSFEDQGGATKWHVNLRVDGGKHLNFAETAVADGRLCLQAGGNVGIGTMSPTNKLQVEGATGIRQGRLYLSGGGSWSSLTYNAHHDAANLNWVFPDATRKSVTLEMDDWQGQSRFEVWTSAAPNNWRSHFKITGDNDYTAMAYNGGRVGIGTRDPQEKLHVAGDFVRVDGRGNELAYLGGDAAANDVQLGSMNAGIMRVALYNTAAGSGMDLSCRDITSRDVACRDVFCDDLQTSRFAIPSDRALKEEIAPIQDALATIRRLRGVQFRWKPGTMRSADEDFGLIAQEVAEVLPQLVKESRSGVSLAYLSLIPVLIEAVKELGAQVDELRARVGELEPGSPRSRRDKSAGD